jgi:hypothetical protein
MPPAAEPSDYDQGVTAGRIDARLANHDQHLAKINGEMGRVADRLGELVDGNRNLLLQVQRLGDAADADRKTAISLAEALEKADTARRDKSETQWTPLSRLITILVGVAIIAGVIIAWISLHKTGAKP